MDRVSIFAKRVKYIALLLPFAYVAGFFTPASLRNTNAISNLVAPVRASERIIREYKETIKYFEPPQSSQVLVLDRGQQQQFTDADYTATLGDDRLIGLDGTPFKLIHTSTKPIMSEEECAMIVNECEGHAKLAGGWTTRRHTNYPTTDLPLQELPKSLAFFNQCLQDRIYPLLAHQYRNVMPNPWKLRVADAFVVKYDAAGGQVELKPHRDGSVISFNIALNPSHAYDGGGTWFKGLGRSLKLEQGHIVSHASGVLHGGHPITAGTRYILVAFVILEDYQNFAMRFMNQVWDY